MQDDNIAKSVDNIVNDDSPSGGTVIEPTLSLGTNPSDAQAASASDAGASASSSDDGSAQPVDDSQAQNNIPIAESAEETTDETPEIEDEPEEPKESTDQSPPAPGSSDLESIKSSALEELMPIVGELDQEPEEKFRTLMMLIQSSDKQDLIKDAFEVAEKIEDKKEKAEALLNIVNEINYFTGKDNK